MGEIPQAIRLRRNLEDAGCGDAMIRQFLQLQQEGKRQEQLRLLALHRESLLDRLHSSQHKIDCLDYLIYRMKKQETDKPDKNGGI